MGILNLTLKNTLRHPIRSLLTSLGIAIALLAFFMIRTFINAWHEGVRASASDRLITRNQMSLIFPLPRSYLPRIQNVPGIDIATSGTWFGGIYKDEKYHFAQFAVDDNYLDVYPEFVLDRLQRKAFLSDKRGIIIGRDVANKFGIKAGDPMTLKGTIYPGDFDFIVRGVFLPKDGVKDTRFALFHYDYLNERIRQQESGPSPDYVAYFAMLLKPGADAVSVSASVDKLFKNSFAETLTQTETAFIQGFVSMSSTLLLAMEAVSLVVIPIILLVLTNTMLMTARERSREYSILRAIGFGDIDIAVTTIGEASLISLCGFFLLCVLIIPIFRMSANFVLGQLANFFPKFPFNTVILLEAFAISLLVGFLAGLVSFVRIGRIKITTGLRMA